VYDSGAEEYEEIVDDGEEFEVQSDDDDFIESGDEDDENSDVEILNVEYDETVPRRWSNKRNLAGVKSKQAENQDEEKLADGRAANFLMTDNLSSDDEDEDELQNRIGRVPLHWYDEHDHVGYDVHGSKITKSSKGDGIDAAIAADDDLNSKKFTIYDALNDKEVQLTDRQIEIIRRMQGGAVAHPEHDANPDMIDYFSGVNKEISGLTSNQYEKKSRFQPSKWEALQVKKLLHRLRRGNITIDFLNGKVRDMNDVTSSKLRNGPFMLWKGDEEDINDRRGPEYIPPPKQAPPTHAESYNPSDEYLPSEQELADWEKMEPSERPHGLIIPKKYPNLRSLGAYEHAVRERFERCLDLYLCPRVLKKRLNIDPESLVPQLPKASDLRPYPTEVCVEYKVKDSDVMVRCISTSPNGQYLISGYEDGMVRLWEVTTARMLQHWNLNDIIASLSGKAEEDVVDDEKAEKSVVSIRWNPNKEHHCFLAAIGRYAFVFTTNTGSVEDTELTEALLSNAMNPPKINNVRAAKAVEWKCISNLARQQSLKNFCGPVCVLQTKFEISKLEWHRRGDYFVTVAPNAAASSVLIHQLSKANTQQPFNKNKGGSEVQCACFHPNKPFLFVANKQQVRVYHLMQQKMIKKLKSGCRWIQSLSVHPSGDHVIVGSLDRRMVWFDLDLSDAPYKTLKYHEKALRSVSYHARYPLMASASDDGNVHIFHSMVYSDLMRNPLIVPLKILRGHKVVKKLGVLEAVFHPTQPWIFTAGSDGIIKLYHDL